MKWIEVKIQTSSENEDVISSILYEMGVGGLVIEDAADIYERIENKKEWDIIEVEELLKDYGSGVLVKAYFPETENILNIIKELRKRIEINPEYESGEKLGKIELAEVFEKDWENSWKKFYKTTKLGEKVVIKPSWEEYNPEKDEVLVTLDPGMAFGTGTHETTKLCVEILEKLVKKDTTVLDVGSGSGILSVVAAKLGAKKVVGIDISELAVRVSKENIKKNNVEDIVEIRQGDLIEAVDEKFDIIVANILAEIIMILNKDIRASLKENSIFIASGIIVGKKEEVIESLEKNGMEIIEVYQLEEWVAITSKLK